MIKTYAHHAPDKECLDKIKQLREGFSQLHTLIGNLTPPSREQSIAITNLETAAMWAVKSLVCNDPNSKVEM